MKRLAIITISLVCLTGCLEAEQALLDGPFGWVVQSIIKSSGYKYVAVGHSGKAYVSDDGFSWTPVTISSEANIRFNGIIYSNSKFIAVGSNNLVEKIFYSTDGSSWTEATYTNTCFNSGGGGSRELFDIAAGNGIIVAAGQDDAVAPNPAACFLKSSDGGITWTGGGNGTVNMPAKKIAYTGTGAFLTAVNVGSNTTSYSSTDGLAYTVTTAANPLGAASKGHDLGDIDFVVPNMVVVTGGSSGTLGQPKTSAISIDAGTSWTPESNAIFAGNTNVGDDMPRAIAFNGSILVAVGDNCQIDSTNNIGSLVWNGVANVMQTSCASPDWTDLAWDGSKFIAVGADDSSSEPWVAVSTSGTSNSWSLFNAIDSGTANFLQGLAVRP